MGKRKPNLKAIAAKIIARTNLRTEAWEVEIPEVAHVPAAHVDDAKHAIDRAMAVIGEGPARDALAVALQALTRLAESIDEQYGPLITLQDHANNLRECCAEMVTRAEEADEIRDAIARYPGTAPRAWEEALHVVRTGAPLRDMWAAGKI